MTDDIEEVARSMSRFVTEHWHTWLWVFIASSVATILFGDLGE